MVNYASFPSGTFYVTDKATFDQLVTAYIFWCVTCGLWSGLIIGLITEYYTSNSYRPVQVAEVCRYWCCY